MVSWKRDKVCPDCGVRTKMGERVDMSEACDKMWRKYHQLDDRPCGVWSNAKVATVTTAQNIAPHSIVWANMPRVIGRS